MSSKYSFCSQSTVGVLRVQDISSGNSLCPKGTVYFLNVQFMFLDYSLYPIVQFMSELYSLFPQCAVYVLIL